MRRPQRRTSVKSRRLRRELLNTDASILYESDDQEDRQGPVTRARKLDQDSMEISSEQQEGEQAQSEQPLAMNPPPPPPPPMYNYPIGSVARWWQEFTAIFS